MEIKTLPSVEYIRSRFAYDAAAGVLTWRERVGDEWPIRSWNTKYAGTAAGTPNSWGYMQVRLDGRIYPAHRLIWACANGEWPQGEIDHINCEKADNRLGNLRVVRRDQNALNRGVQKNNKTGLKGASWNPHRQKFVSQIRAYGKHHWLGYFDSAEEAHKAYLAKAATLHGEFARAA